MDRDNPTVTKSKSCDSTLDARDFVDSLQLPSDTYHSSSHLDAININSMATTTLNTDPTSTVSDKWTSIPVLNSSNFFDWKLRLETALGARRLKKFISSNLPFPSDPNELETHQVNDARAREAIQCTIDPGNFQVISQCSTARSAYLAILKHHDDSGGLSTTHLFSELATL